MKKITIEPSWIFRDENNREIDNKLFELLHGIHEHGKLTEACKTTGISYRHGWNLIQNWSEFFETPLVSLQKGRGANLNPIGEKLLWMRERAEARFSPQMSNLSSELNAELRRLAELDQPKLRVSASHGYAVAMLPELCTELDLAITYTHPREALEALNDGRCDMAGIHIPCSDLPEGAHPDYLKLLNPNQHVLIRFSTRQQGLMLAKDNPKEIEGLSDLVRDDIQFINRNPDSGTRLLLQFLMQQEGLDLGKINGFESEEFTHSAVAAHIAAGMADTGFGVGHAAKQFGLDFLHLASEHYVFVVNKATVEETTRQLFIEQLKSVELQRSIRRLFGYHPIRCGDIQAAVHTALDD